MALYVDSAFLHDIMNVAQTIPYAGLAKDEKTVMILLCV